jgi:hypothetical protein
MTRAWTFQEGYLSKRLLVFSEHQTSFYCGTASWTEGLGGLEHIKKPDEIAWDLWETKVLPFDVPSSTSNPNLPPDGGSIYRRFRDFLSLAMLYTLRKCKYDSDALNAFSGIMHFWQETEPRILNVAGLPYAPLIIDEADSKEKYLFLALSWYHSTIPTRRPAFPSWTWAGWAAPAYWLIPHWRNETRFYFPLIQDAYFASEDSLICVHSDLSNAFLSNVIGVQFTASLVPAEGFTTKGLAPLDQGTTWDQVRIYGARLGPSALRLSETPSVYQKNIQQGVWSCLALGFKIKYRRPDEVSDVFLLVVEWKDHLTAVRVNGFNVWGHMLPSFLQTLERKTVRLV